MAARAAIEREILGAFDVAFDPEFGVAKAMHFLDSTRIFAAQFLPRRILFQLLL